MAGIFSSILETITELSTPHALQHLRPIWRGVDEQLQKLGRSLMFIQPLVEDADARQLTDQALRCWLWLLKDAVLDAEDILDEAKTHELLIQRKADLCGRPRSKVREFFSLDHNPLLFRVQLGKKLRDINERINGLIEEMHKFKLRVVESKPLMRNRPQTCSFVNESRVIIGRDEDKEKVVQMLISDDGFDEKVAVVSIVGMGGLGKTTLAQLVYGDERVQKRFELRIWVCVSDDFDVPKLAGKIIHTASGKISDHTNLEVFQQDLGQILGEKRYLLVLDDVWNEDFQKWDALRNMLLVGGEGSRVLVTTRNEKCSRLMGASKPHVLSGLSEENSWVLFEQKAFAIEAEQKQAAELVEIGKKIVEKCKGLPLAIEVVGRIMSYKSKESEWRAVLENEIWNLQHTANKIMPELWLSYVDLPTHLKKCFAFCAIFPKDHDIDVEKLILYWMAHGFIPSQTRNDMETKGQEIFTELTRRSLLQYDYSLHEIFEGRRLCKMHDLIHDLAHFVMENECFTLSKSSASTEIIPIRPRHLLYSPAENCNQDECSIIRTVLRCGVGELSVLSKLKLVRVLNLFCPGTDKLPASIEHLQHLRYLKISFSKIRKLPESICKLVNLQTLILNCCRSLSELPKSIVYMSSLRHLLIHECLSLRTLPPAIMSLQNLKTITKYIVGDDAENNIGQLKSLNLRGEFELYNLQNAKNADEAQKANLSHKQIHTLKLYWSGYDNKDSCSIENAEEVLEALKPHNEVKELTVSDYPGKQFPMWMREGQQLQYLVCLDLIDCRGCQQLPPLEILPCLEELTIKFMDGIKHIVVNNRRSNAPQPFPALKNLKLLRMKNLEGWCEEDEEDREADILSLFPSLIYMDIRGCPKLTTIPSIPTLQALDVTESFSQVSRERGFFKHLNSLETLYIKSCTEDLVLLLKDEEETRAIKSSLKHLSITMCHQPPSPMVSQNLTSLEEPDMMEIDKLVSWPDEIMLRDFKSLKYLYINGWKNLTGGSSLVHQPPFLELLEVTACDALKELPKCPTSLRILSVVDCPLIESLMPEMGHLNSLFSLNLYKCPKLVSLPDGMQGLTSLRSLSIEGCTALKSFPEGLQQLLPAVEDLCITRCPELEKLCKPGGDYDHLLSTIPCKQIGAMQEQAIELPQLDENSTGGKQALKRIAANPFLLSAIFVCVVTCSIWFYFIIRDSKVPFPPPAFYFVHCLVFLLKLYDIMSVLIYKKKIILSIFGPYFKHDI